MQITTHIPGLITPYDYEALTVTTAVKTLTANKYLNRGSEAARDMGEARAVMISVEGKIRYRIDGGNPTDSDGHILYDGDVLTLGSHSQFANFKAFREAGESSDATLRVTYFR